MELKCAREAAAAASEASFNRTFMELKFPIDTAICFAFLRFNRTFMELKFASLAAAAASRAF